MIMVHCDILWYMMIYYDTSLLWYHYGILWLWYIWWLMSAGCFDLPGATGLHSRRALPTDLSDWSFWWVIRQSHRCHFYPRSSPLQWWDLPFFASCWCSLPALWTREALVIKTAVGISTVTIWWWYSGNCRKLPKKTGSTVPQHFLHSIGHCDIVLCNHKQVLSSMAITIQACTSGSACFGASQAGWTT